MKSHPISSFVLRRFPFFQPNKSGKSSLASLLALGVFCSSSMASSWDNTAGGAFSDSGNWSAGVPGPGDTATFYTPSETYTVTFGDDVETGLLRMGSGVVTFQIGDGTNFHTYTATNFQAGYDNFPEAGTLRISEGTLRLTGGDINVAQDSNRNSTILVEGPNSSLIIDNELFSRRGNFTLEVTDGASFSAGTFRIVQRGNSSILVDDADLTVNGTMSLGQETTLSVAANVQMEVRNGGDVSVERLDLAVQNFGGGGWQYGPGGQVAQLDVVGENSIVRSEGALIVGRRSVATGNANNQNPTAVNTGTINILDGGRVLSGDTDSTTFREATIGFDDNGLGGRGVGFATVSGENSLWRIGSETNRTDLRIAHNGGQGSMVISTAGAVGGDGFLTGGVDVFGATHIGELGTLTMQGGNLRTYGLLSLDPGGTLAFELSPMVTTSRITVDGDGFFNIGVFDPGEGELVLNLASGFFVSAPTIFTLIDYDEWSGEFFNGLGQDAQILLSEGGNDWVSILNYGSNALTLTVIPEPATLSLLLIATAFGMMRRPKRR